MHMHVLSSHQDNYWKNKIRENIDFFLLFDMNETIEISNCTLSTAEVFEALSNIGSDPIPGPDLIPPLFFIYVSILS